MGIALVSGGAGFLGSHLVDHLLARDLSVRVLDNLSTGSLRNLQRAADGQAPSAGPAERPLPPSNGRRLELMVGDVRDERLVRRAMQHVEYVFHLAALPAVVTGAISPKDMHGVNVQGTLNVLQAATAEGVRRVVFASCASVYGTADAAAVSEDVAPAPRTMFAASKLAGEIYCRTHERAYGLETVVLRYFAVYGPRQSGLEGALVPTLIQQLRSRRRPTVVGDARTAQDLMYADDAVTATIAAALRPEAAGRTINVASGHSASTIEVLDILNRLLRTEAVPRLVRPRAGYAPAPRAGTALAQELLGCAPRVSLVAGLARAVEAVSEGDEDGLLAEIGSGEERSHL